MPTGAGISSNSLTLQQYANQSNDPLIQRIVYSLLEVGSVLNDIPYVTKPTQKVNGARVTGNLPTAAWRKINAESTVTSGTATPFQEQVYILSNVLDVDRLILLDENSVGNPMATQVDMLLKSISYDITDKFFNNNHGTGNTDAFVGIRQRLDDPATWDTATANKIDAGGVALNDANISQTSANTFIRYIDQLLDSIGDPDGNDVVIYMNRDLRRRAAESIRLLGVGAGFAFDKTDAFDRRLMTYRNAIVRSVGVKADQTTEIITSTETTAGVNSNSTYTSLYGVKYGEGFFSGWQMEPLRVIDVGLRSDEPNIYRLFLEWANGIYQENIRAIGRVYDIKVGA